MLERSSIILILCLGFCFSLVIFVAVQEKRHFTGVKNIYKTPNEDVSILENNERVLQSLKGDIENLTEAIRLLSHSSESNLSFEVFNKSFNSLNEKLSESNRNFKSLTNTLIAFRQSLQTKETKEEHAIENSDYSDIKDKIDKLQYYEADLRLSIIMLKEDFDKIYSELKKMNETESINVVSEMTANFPDSNKTDSFINNKETDSSTPESLYDDYNVETNCITWNDVNADETGALINTPETSTMNIPGISYDNYDVEESFGLNLYNSVTDENGAVINANNETDAPSVSKMHYGDDNVEENSYLEMSLYNSGSDESRGRVYSEDIGAFTVAKISVNDDGSAGENYSGNELNGYAANETQANFNNTDGVSTDFLQNQTTIEDSNDSGESYPEKFMIDDNFLQDTKEVLDARLEEDIDSITPSIEEQNKNEVERLIEKDTTPFNSIGHQKQPEFTLYINRTMTICEAVQACEEMGQVLASIKNAEEEEQVIALIKKTENAGKHLRDDKIPSFSRSNTSIMQMSDKQESQMEFSLYIDTKVTFLEALMSCGEINMKLATIKSVVEQEKVVALIKKTGQTFPYVMDADFWISGLKTDESETFVWFDEMYYTFTDMNYTNWNNGQPKTYTTPGVIYFWQGCAFLDHEHGYLWNSSHCDEPIKYAVCESLRL